MIKFTKGKILLGVVSIAATGFGWLAEDIFKTCVFKATGVEDDDEFVKKIDTKNAEDDEEEKKA